MPAGWKDAAPLSGMGSKKQALDPVKEDFE